MQILIQNFQKKKAKRVSKVKFESGTFLAKKKSQKGVDARKNIC